MSTAGSDTVARLSSASHSRGRSRSHIDCGDQDDRRRPRDAVDHALVAVGGAGEVDRVADGDDRQRARDQHERRAAGTGEHDAAGDEAEQQQVAERVGEVGRLRERRALQQMLEPAKREAGAHGRRAERDDAGVDPARRAPSAELAPDEQDDAGEREREEPEVEGIGERWRRRLRAAERLERQREVATRPHQAPQPERDRGLAPFPAADAGGDAQAARDHLDGNDRPAVDRRRVLVGAAQQQVAEIPGEQNAEYGEDRPHGRRAARLRGASASVRVPAVPPTAGRLA